MHGALAPKQHQTVIQQGGKTTAAFFDEASSTNVCAHLLAETSSFLQMDNRHGKLPRHTKRGVDSGDEQRIRFRQGVRRWKWKPGDR